MRNEQTFTSQDTSCRASNLLEQALVGIGAITQLSLHLNCGIHVHEHPGLGNNRLAGRQFYLDVLHFTPQTVYFIEQEGAIIEAVS